MPCRIKVWDRSPATSPGKSTEQQNAELPFHAAKPFLGDSISSDSTPAGHHSGVTTPSSKAWSEAWRHDLMLLHHYTTLTAQTLSSRDEVRQVWRQVFPELAYKHDYLMRGILALSALHLAHSKPEKSSFYSNVSLHHHNQGLALFQEILPNIGLDSFKPAFAFSSALSICAFQQSISGFVTELYSNPVDGFVDAYYLLQGLVRIIHSMRGEWPDIGSLTPLLPGYPIPRSLPHGLQERFAKLT